MKSDHELYMDLLNEVLNQKPNKQMKVEVNEKGKTKEMDFPKLMVDHNGGVVLFISPKKGTVLEPTSFEVIGEFYENWNMSCFTDFEGSITLSNE